MFKLLIGKLKNKKPFAVFIVILLLLIGGKLVSLDAEQRYLSQLSIVTYDRMGVPISVESNVRGHYAYKQTDIPTNFKNLLVKKEDRFYYYHFGVNPVSSLRAFYNFVTTGKAGGSSTITQQLAKNLLGTENERTLVNKITEALYAISIELFNNKEEILEMYVNSVYLGNQIQGFGTASLAYFDKPLENSNHSEQLSLLATLSYPSSRNPWEAENEDFARSLGERISPEQKFVPPKVTSEYTFQKDSYFEISTSGVGCETSCRTTIDHELTTGLRKILNRHIDDGWENKVRNGAIVVIDPKTEEALALIGSRNPSSEASGNQINMAIQPRPIGSTIKPFIYAKGFEDGLRPYSLVEDREYKYPIATGYSLYPKNYDGQYHGEVTLHEALSNSLNVPSVKVLEYIGLDNFYSFLSQDLQFEPIQDYDSYQYGIALGGLEMDLLTLTHYFTLFPKEGTLAPLRIMLDSSNNFGLPEQSDITETKKVVDEAYVELVHMIISDRFTGVNQFGLKSNLNLTTDGYGVKTGTSRDYHDSWVVGYTGDFVVGVWLGNVENEAMSQVSGSTGAGAVWHDVMEYLLATDYNQNSQLTISNLERFNINGVEEWGMVGDVVEEHQTLLLKDNLILSIHEEDVYELTDDLTIPLKARRSVDWSANGTSLGEDKEVSFKPTETGRYEISAFDKSSGEREIIIVEVIQPE